jgi:hypothetical protein
MKFGNGNHGKASLRRRVFGVLRVAGYTTIVSLLCAVLAARAVRADFMEGSLRIGRELEGLGDVVGSPKTVFINGSSMYIATAFTDQMPREVLDRFEAMCEEHPDFMTRAFKDIPTALLEKAKIKPSLGLHMGVARQEVDGEGALACITDSRPSSLRELGARFKAFMETKDLAELGSFHYVYVKHNDKGTHVRTIWTEGPFNLGQMFPAKGDAAGFDSPFVPRPPLSKRILSATALQVPYGVHIYDSAEAPDAVRTFYERELDARGWKRAGQETHNTSVYMKDSGTMVYVTLSPGAGRTVVTTTETVSRDTPTEARVRLP